ncbi:hypothetical protein CA264_07705 [Pontibacter actiniarum]|uniref:Uncharacterized protein n=1 Tax=Pontibacter actiniarum TaxID=323450 RepID=A0A1X9YR40_9BACT|nr:hypothetical protein CA264_07705 [Pontibacter actiniarum]
MPFILLQNPWLFLAIGYESKSSITVIIRILFISNFLCTKVAGEQDKYKPAIERLLPLSAGTLSAV